MRMLASLAFGCVTLAASCAPMPTVALQATPADLEMLAGEWTGEYESTALGRHGSIEFKLKAGTNDAYGDVVMVPQGRRMPYQRQPDHYTHDTPGPPPSEFLTIKFIRASNGSLTGMLDRYWDPDRDCYATSTFNGNIGLGVVEGTFKTTFECGSGDATGRWTARKKAAKTGAARR